MMKANINGITVEVEDSTITLPDETITEPTIEERLEAVEAALLEQMLRGLSNV